CQQYNSDPCTF
nr:immunoglobulin light chain junction region [Macaca mulatta]MOW44593.1 immunoglobulin light chain junction region [Macaca mulatta]